ncbi:DUF4318 domain-containing protein [Clostridium perfringens]|uniref:DUF4318 domain-containing protein n=1 Tax=Clostridium perfringens TaxID=1502 RepID=UPI0010943054|nr:DUF4318 domain-containing protein [Clostridium perfringens]MDK0651537.1 DUF4318 domain-containing protein [Clostridium perfringens]MDM0627430.1 DUF4318 domain-containing protein [Clostridium perfringens]TGY43037.1 DUF4318 domain-containing protein [Clostridium perfringens]
MLKKGFLIDLDIIPKTDTDICLEVAKYCAKNNLSFEFIKRTSPVVATIEGIKYKITKIFHNGMFLNCWVLSCKEVD